MDVDGLVFDLYGTGLEVTSLSPACADVTNDPDARDRPRAAWLGVRPYPEVPDVLAALGSGRVLVAFSNGGPSMLEEGLQRAVSASSASRRL